MHITAVMWICLVLLTVTVHVCRCANVTGMLRYVVPTSHDDRPFRVELWSLPSVGLSKSLVWGDFDPLQGNGPVLSTTVQVNSATGESPFLLSGTLPPNTDPGLYTVFAYQQVCGGGERLCADGPDNVGQLLGWPDDSAICIGGKDSMTVCADGVFLVKEPCSAHFANPIHLHRLVPLARGRVERLSGGVLNTTGPIPTLSLSGTPSQRGYAHGYLVGRQILDILDYLMVQDVAGGVVPYEEEYLPLVKPPAKLFAWPDEVIEEVGGMIEGMGEAGAYFSPMLSRNVTIWVRPRTLGTCAPILDGVWQDILALNSYGEMWWGGWPRAGGSEACTQIVAWGDMTRDTDVTGNTVTGRNMDGEIDLRKATVIHLLVFGVEGLGMRKMVSVMWPGFIGTYSGFNEGGTHLMLNAGCPAPISGSKEESGYLPATLLVRDLLSSPLIPPTPSPEEVANYVKHVSQNTSLGGACLAGDILVFGQPRGTSYEHPGGFIYECDAAGGKARWSHDPQIIRSPGGNGSLVLATNHFLSYEASGSPSEDPCSYLCNGAPASYSSMWRYTVAANSLGMFSRATSGTGVGTAAVKETLRRACHGTTEHSIVFRPGEMVFEVARASPSQPMWDAPVGEWHTLHFDDLFRP